MVDVFFYKKKINKYMLFSLITMYIKKVLVLGIVLILGIFEVEYSSIYISLTRLDKKIRNKYRLEVLYNRIREKL